MRTRYKWFKGFTLVELLVVLAIIAILLAMLLPVLSRVKISAWTAVCVHNIRQVAAAVLLYSNDYNGAIPWCRGWGPQQPPQDQGGGSFEQGGYIGWVRSLTDAGMLPISTRTKQDGVLFCPHKRAIIGGNPVTYYPRNYSHYAYSNLGGVGQDIPPWDTTGPSYLEPASWKSYQSGSYGPYRMAQIRSKADTIMVADGPFHSPDGVTYWCMDQVTYPQPQNANAGVGGFYQGPNDPGALISYRLHHGRANCAFFDGHVESLLCPVSTNRMWQH